MKSVTLGGLKSGISRLREKGGASKDTLYDLVNGYVDASGSVVSRPGTRVAYTLPAGTKGVCAFDGQLQVFAAREVAGMPADVVLNILRHPDPAFAGEIAEIHFGKPFVGHLYVAAEFDDGSTYHYWLNDADEWVADHIYLPGDTASPTVKNGFLFEPSPTEEHPEWAPNVRRQVGDVIVPTEPNGYKYTVVSVDGDSPASGAFEPDWKAADGAKVYESATDTTPPDDDDSGSSDDGPYGGTIGGLPGYKQRQLDQDVP